MRIFRVIFNYAYKAVRKICFIVVNMFEYWATQIVFAGNNIKHGSFRTSGVPYVMVERGANCTIGDRFSMHNGTRGNPIGVFNKCSLVVYKGASLKIENDVGISQTALIAYADITIGTGAKLGGGVSVYTTDFHSLNPLLRSTAEDIKTKVVKPVVIKENAFIGAHSIILKGVTIGRNSIIGAGSVVTKSVPDNEIWAGNPAKFIKKLNYDNKNDSSSNDGAQPS